MTSLLDTLAPVLAEGATPRVLTELATRLAAALGGSVDVWLADYRQVMLRSALRGDTAAVDDSRVGRCFASQSVLAGDAGVCVPITSRGDRVGVLEVRCPVPDTAELQTVASLLAQLLRALNGVTSSYERDRRRRPMTVAAELQWALLPGQAYADEALSVAGMLEPAYSIAGDAYDWAREDDTFCLAVLDGTGRGVPAALATTLALSALRNARLAAVSLADQAALTDQAIYAHYGGQFYTSALLFEFDVRDGVARVIDAGSPMLLRQRAGRVELIELEAQLPLGMLEESLYVEQAAEIAPGDRLLIVSDGVHAAVGADGRTFGPEYIEQLLRDSRLLSAAETARHITRELGSLHGEDGPEDDAVVVCLDWRPL